MTTYTLTPQEREAAQENFHRRDRADALMQNTGGGVSASRLHAYAQGILTGDAQDIETALDKDAALRAAYRTMVRDAALFVLPEAMAASSDALPVRETRGCKLSLKPSRAEETQFYLIVELDDATKGEPSTLAVCGADNRTHQIALPPSRGGIIQVIVERDSDIVRLLRDPKSEAYLR